VIEKLPFYEEIAQNGCIKGRFKRATTHLISFEYHFGVFFMENLPINNIYELIR